MSTPACTASIQNKGPPLSKSFASAFTRRIAPGGQKRSREQSSKGHESKGSSGSFRRRGPLRYLGAIVHPVVGARGELEEFVATVVDVTERKHAEKEQLAQLWFLESMDVIDRAIQGTSDLEQMMGNVLDAVLKIFRCDRAWLLYPCDPDAASLRMAAERTRPEYAGALDAGTDIPNEPEAADVARSLLAADGPVRFDPESDCALPSGLAERFDIKSIIA